MIEGGLAVLSGTRSSGSVKSTGLVDSLEQGRMKEWIHQCVITKEVYIQDDIIHHQMEKQKKTSFETSVHFIIYLLSVNRTKAV